MVFDLENVTLNFFQEKTTYPRNIHYNKELVSLLIKFAESTNEIVVTWSTRDDTKESIVEYGQTTLSLSSKSKPIKFVDGGKGHSTQYIHKVTLSHLTPSTRYVYHCGSSFGWSAEYWFVTPPSGTQWSPRLAIFGDMGNENAQSLARLQQDTQRGMYDAIIHVGDFAYDMDSENAEVGNEFMRQIETVAAYLPYMVCAGNHEERYNFSNYRARFSMPGGTENLMYSFDLGPVHFIGFSTEVYYFLKYGYKPLINQYYWLEKDLEEATKPANRAVRPWIITYGHRPMYCSNDNGDDCSKHETVIRKGLPLLGFFGLEDLFYKYGVDVELWAHEHSYERLWPMYDYKMYNGSMEKPYTNPGAPVHLVTGSAGCKEGREPFDKIIPEWSAFHSQDYGYTRMTAHNVSHLYFEQVSDDKNGTVIDSFWIIKDKHDSVEDIVVTWSTRDDTIESVVEYGKWNSQPNDLLKITGESQLFTDGGPKQRSQYIHKVVLKDLKPKTKYRYTCGSSLGWSAVFWFTTPPSGENWSPRLAIFGDMGNENAQSLSRLQTDTQHDMYDAIIHVGDFAYDMDTEDAAVGDEFMRQIESVAGYLPYMVCVGNHEEKYNFSNYKTRFNMPGNTDSMWYSFNLGPVHFVSYSTEVYYFLNYGIKMLIKQYEWLENDLKDANMPENRAKRPWIITYGHRPMYCSDDKEYDCNDKLETFIRKGIPPLDFFGIEDLFYKYGVDVEIMAHEHFYTRLWPIYDFKVYNGSKEAPYTNPNAPVQIITGSAGCSEKKEPFSSNLPDWNAFHSNDYGYTRMKAHNGTHLYFEQVSDEKDGAIVDSFWIIKDKHGGYSSK